MEALSKKKVVVTGGTRGIGLAIATKLQHDGHEVLVTSTKNNGGLDKNFLYHQADFSTISAINEFANFLKSYSPDILINNAGINMISPFEEITLESFLKIQQVNVTAPFCLSQAVLSNMKKNHWGRIINIASMGKFSSDRTIKDYASEIWRLD